MKSGINFYQNVHYRVYNQDGTLKEDKWTHNQTQQTVLEEVIDAIDTGSCNNIDAMAIGTGTGQGVSATALASISSYEVGASLSSTQSGTPEDEVEFSTTFTAGGSWNIEEAGLLTDGTDANSGMCFYDDSISVSMTSGDTLQIDWTVSVS